MTTSSADVMLSNASDTTFRTWTKAVSDAILAVGLVKTADTGQINFTTVAAPGGAAVSRGYEIFRFNDTLQATRPVFIKVEYGSSANSQDCCLYVTVGTNTDGAGTVTGTTSSRFSYRISSTVAAAYASPMYASCDGSGIGMAFTFSSSASAVWDWRMGMFIERSRNADGTPNGNGLMVTGFLGLTTPVLQYLSFTLATASSSSINRWPVPVPGRLTSYVTGTDVGVFPAVVCTPSPQGPSLLVLGCAPTDFPRNTMQQILVSGVVRNYLALTGSSLGSGSCAGSSVAVLMRYE